MVALPISCWRELSPLRWRRPWRVWREPVAAPVEKAAGELEKARAGLRRGGEGRKAGSREARWREAAGHAWARWICGRRAPDRHGERRGLARWSAVAAELW